MQGFKAMKKIISPKHSDSVSAKTRKSSPAEEDSATERVTPEVLKAARLTISLLGADGT